MSSVLVGDSALSELRRRELRALTASLLLSVVLAIAALAVGVVSGIRVIVFDGAYMAVGLILSWASLQAARRNGGAHSPLPVRPRRACPADGRDSRARAGRDARTGARRCTRGHPRRRKRSERCRHILVRTCHRAGRIRRRTVAAQVGSGIRPDCRRGVAMAGGISAQCHHVSWARSR